MQGTWLMALLSEERGAGEGVQENTGFGWAPAWSQPHGSEPQEQPPSGYGYVGHFKALSVASTRKVEPTALWENEPSGRRSNTQGGVRWDRAWVGEALKEELLSLSF